MPATQPTPSRQTQFSRRHLLRAVAWVGAGLATQACTLLRDTYPPAPPPIPYQSPTPEPTHTPTVTPTPTLTLTPTSTATPTSTPTATFTPGPTLPVPELEVVRPIGKGYPLPAGFTPSALALLVSYPSVQVRAGREGLRGHPEAVAALSRLFSAARQAGISDMYVDSAYRSTATQAAMWQSAGGTSQRRVAPPGTSEHESGLAFDFVALGAPSGFASSTAGRWMRANAHRFGFVSTYSRQGIDGIGYEPWHWRYVGEATSTQLYVLGYLAPDSKINPIAFYAVIWDKNRD